MRYGISYMGSKSGIVSSLALALPKAENFYDLFGGGFSVTHYMMLECKHKYNSFHYNELNPLLAPLIKDAILGAYNYDVFKPEFVSREEFHKRKSTDGYVAYLWSFGNDGRTYMFAPAVEIVKKSAHQAVVFDEFDDFIKDFLGFDCWDKSIDTIYKRRIYVYQRATFINKKLGINKVHVLRQLEQLQQLEGLERLQQLQQLERLEQIQRLENLSTDKLTITTKDYRDVQIKENSIVYCDIPYKNTSGYTGNKENAFSHIDFYEWAANANFPVYISEYNISDERFELVYGIQKRSTKASSLGNGSVQTEKLYWNRVKLK